MKIKFTITIMTTLLCCLFPLASFAIDRYVLSAAFTPNTNFPLGAADGATSTIGNTTLSEDGKTLSYEFMGKVPGEHRLFFRVERRDGVEATGSFVLQVVPSAGYGSAGGPRGNGQGRGSGGGCNAGIGALTALVLVAGLWVMRRRRKA